MLRASSAGTSPGLAFHAHLMEELLRQQASSGFLASLNPETRSVLFGNLVGRSLQPQSSFPICQSRTNVLGFPLANACGR